MRSSLCLLTFGLLGCVSLPHAKLVVVGEGVREVVTGPVVCGPLGFRKVPLQARWGEYVRVTVAAPSLITGTVLVHANGIAHEPQSWSTESGALVIDARFPNEDPDARFALERERPIDITLTGLSAPNGGTCEGAVFTVEQGALIPSVDERAWVAELERRGGPELAARRERARVEAEARRQAHYAAWEARQQLEVSAAVVAQAEVVRQAHYAQWEVARSASLSPAGERVGESGNDSAEVVVEASSVAQSEAVVVQSGNTGAACTASGSGVAVSGSSGVASSMVTPTCGAGSVAVSSSVVSSSSSGGGSLAVDPWAHPRAVVPGSVGYEASFSGSASTTSSTAPEFAAFPTASLQPAATVSTVGAAEWSQPSDAALRAPVQTTVVQPSEVQVQASAQVQAGWEQPYQPRLEPVAVSTESQVATSAQPQLQPVAYSAESQVAQPAPCGRCRAPAPAAVSVGVDGAALFNLMLHIGAAATQAPAPVHGAQPISR